MGNHGNNSKLVAFMQGLAARLTEAAERERDAMWFGFLTKKRTYCMQTYGQPDLELHDSEVKIHRNAYVLVVVSGRSMETLLEVATYRAGSFEEMDVRILSKNVLPETMVLELREFIAKHYKLSPVCGHV